ncbi:hypothetical protein F5884DRAFT_640457, partial [Xylogone sp. PMI_703]
ALFIANQLYAFHGCSQEQHQRHDDQHLQREHTCASLADVLPILQGRGADGSLQPLPEVLSQFDVMKPAETSVESCVSAFEGVTLPHSSFLTEAEDRNWFDLILRPCIRQVVTPSNILQYYPLSSDAVRAAALASSHEAYSKKSASREQFRYSPLPPWCLEDLWSAVLAKIEEMPEYHKFSGATLFLDAKNTKLMYMTDSLPQAYTIWQQRWDYVADPRFYSRDNIYVDIGKQTMMVPLPGQAAKTLLWKQCCVNAYCSERRSRGKVRQTRYQFAGLRDTTNVTIKPVQSRSRGVGPVAYTQLYSLIKTTLDAAGVYPFRNSALENLALDPEYVKSLEHEGSSAVFSSAQCMNSYLHSKRRVHFSLTNDGYDVPYGAREEYRDTLAVVDRVCEYLDLWSQDPARAPFSTDQSLPFLAIPTKDLFDFIRAQINKYCFLFEFTLINSSGARPLSVTAIMVTALRALRSCYGSYLLSAESLLVKDKWEQKSPRSTISREGLGMEVTMNQYGLAWFLPKIDWLTWRFFDIHQAHIIQGSMLLHKEYHRRYRLVRDLRNVFIRQQEAERWFYEYDMAHNERLLRKWLEYLHGMNIEQFRADIWKTVSKMNDTHPELAPDVAHRLPEMQFCFLGPDRARRWSNEFFHLMQLTHWILPCAGPRGVLQPTKNNQDQGLISRMMWFSVVYSPGPPPLTWSEDQSYSLSNISQMANLTVFGRVSDHDRWEIHRLIPIYSALGLTADSCRKNWVLGRQTPSSRGLARPEWEQPHQPPRLLILDQIKGKTLEELNDLM